MLMFPMFQCSNVRDDGDMKNYHHPACIFDTFKRVKATTKVKAGKDTFIASRCRLQIIEDPGDLEGWAEVEPGDRKTVLSLIEQHQEVNIFCKTEKQTNVKKFQQPITIFN